MVRARGAFFVFGTDDKEFVSLEGEPYMRTDMVRVGPAKVADVRYRPGFKEWSTVLKIRYNADAITAEQIIFLMNTAGFCSGVGEWRPGKSGGSFGMFEVANGG